LEPICRLARIFHADRIVVRITRLTHEKSGLVEARKEQAVAHLIPGTVRLRFERYDKEDYNQRDGPDFFIQCTGGHERAVSG
jgi:hypothetical protein